MDAAGDPELSEAISEARRCTRQISSEWVRQNPHYLQVVKERFDAVCTRLFEAARNGAPDCIHAPLSNLPGVHKMEGTPAGSLKVRHCQESSWQQAYAGRPMHASV